MQTHTTAALLADVALQGVALAATVQRRGGAGRSLGHLRDRRRETYGAAALRPAPGAMALPGGGR